MVLASRVRIICPGSWGYSQTFFFFYGFVFNIKFVIHFKPCFVWGRFQRLFCIISECLISSAPYARKPTFSPLNHLWAIVKAGLTYAVGSLLMSSLFLIDVSFHNYDIIVIVAAMWILKLGRQVITTVLVSLKFCLNHFISLTYLSFRIIMCIAIRTF